MSRWLLRFSGYLSDDELGYSDGPKLSVLTEGSTAIEREIEEAIRRYLPEADDVQVSISFREGSLEWLGEVQIAIEWMSMLGDTASVVMLVRSIVKWAIDRALRSRGVPNPSTVVTVTRPPLTARQRRVSSGYGEGILGAVCALTGVNTVALLLILWGAPSTWASRDASVILPLLLLGLVVFLMIDVIRKR